MIVDANPIVSACLGRSRALFIALLDREIDLFVPEHQMREVRLVTDREARAQDRDPAPLLAWTRHSLIMLPLRAYSDYEAEARARLSSAGQKDWPLVALALASGDGIWSNDNHLFGTGVAIWTTRNVLRSAPRIDAAPEDESGN